MSCFPGKGTWRKLCVHSQQKELSTLLCACEGWPNAAQAGDMEGAQALIAYSYPRGPSTSPYLHPRRAGRRDTSKASARD